MNALNTSPLPAPEYTRTPPSVIVTILAVSAIASAFLVWLVYFHPPMDIKGTHLSFLPALNATLNGLCAVELILGFNFIRRREIVRHRNAMLAAFLFSSLFLVSYITNHALHGESHLPIAHTGVAWYSYATLLTSHILLSIIALPMILITFFLSLSGRFTQHRALARYTLPVWLYVSVTGVLVYLAQAAIRP